MIRLFSSFFFEKKFQETSVIFYSPFSRQTGQTSFSQNILRKSLPVLSLHAVPRRGGWQAAQQRRKGGGAVSNKRLQVKIVKGGLKSEFIIVGERAVDANFLA
jgi:hypothetical protein